LAEEKPPCWLCIRLMLDLAEDIGAARASKDLEDVRYYRKGIRSAIQTLSRERCIMEPDAKELQNLHDKLKASIREKRWSKIMDNLEGMGLALRSAVDGMLKKKLCEV